AVSSTLRQAEREQHGDVLTDRLVRAALKAAEGELERGTSPAESARGLLLALGVSLDVSGLLEKHPVSPLVLGGIETEEEKRARTVALARGRPTLSGRQDSLQHFAVSAALAALAPEAAAWAAGLQKEVEDAQGKDSGKGTGFSFADLAADQAGIA